jgi:hypothetical protein
MNTLHLHCFVAKVKAVVDLSSLDIGRLMKQHGTGERGILRRSIKYAIALARAFDALLNQAVNTNVNIASCCNG